MPSTFFLCEPSTTSLHILLGSFLFRESGFGTHSKGALKEVVPVILHRRPVSCGVLLLHSADNLCKAASIEFKATNYTHKMWKLSRRDSASQVRSAWNEISQNNNFRRIHVASPVVSSSWPSGLYNPSDIEYGGWGPCLGHPPCKQAQMRHRESA